jgi:hypothetical protein
LVHKTQLTVQRAMSSAAAGNAMPALLVDDFRNPSAKPSPRFCRSLAEEFKDIQDRFPLARQFPHDRKRIRAVVHESMMAEFRRSATPKALALKPGLDANRYLVIDGKPAACVRARLRLGVALTPRRHHLYGHSPTAECPCGGGVGDVAHVLMACPRHEQARSACANDLQRHSYPVPMSLDLLLGNRPDLSRHRHVGLCRSFLDLMHDFCLSVTSKFLLSIDNQIHL